MKVAISIMQDNYNSYPSGDVIFEIGTKSVTISFSDDDREVTVSLKDFVSIAHLMMNR